MNTNQIASELSYAVMLKRQRELNGRDVPKVANCGCVYHAEQGLACRHDVPKVTAPAEKPAKFDAYPVVIGHPESGQIVRVGR